MLSNACDKLYAVNFKSGTQPKENNQINTVLNLGFYQ